MLGDVGQGLLHDAVERRLDLGGQALVAELRFHFELEAGLARKGVGRGARAPATSPKSSSAFGRSSTARRLHAVQRVDDLFADCRERPRALPRVDRFLDGPQAEQDTEISSWPV